MTSPSEGRLVAWLVAVGVFAAALVVSVDSDTFWHLRAGAWMLEHGRLLDFDAFSHTVAGRHWINHSWLTEALMAALQRAAGFGGLNVATALIVAVTLLVVYASDDADPWVRAFAVALAAAATSIYWGARPQIVSLLLAAVTNRVLIRHRVFGVNRLWLLPVLMVAWVNLHGGFAIGLMLVGVTLTGETLALLLRRIDPAADVRPGVAGAGAGLAWLAAATIACVAAVALNPYGVAMLAYPFKTVSMGVLRDYIQEWQSPNFHVRSAQWFIVLLFATFAAVGRSRMRLEATDFLLVAVFGSAALLAARNIPVFAIVTAPVLMRHAGSIVADHAAARRELDRGPLVRAPLGRGLAGAALAVAVAVAIARAAVVVPAAATERVIARSLPARAAEVVRVRPAAGRLFNAYNFGGYLSWALDSVPVFVDGRTDLYDDAFLNEYIATYMAAPGWEQNLARHGVGVVLVDPAAPIANALLARPGWAEVYRDRVAVVLEKR